MVPSSSTVRSSSSTSCASIPSTKSPSSLSSPSKRASSRAHGVMGVMNSNNVLLISSPICKRASSSSSSYTPSQQSSPTRASSTVNGGGGGSGERVTIWHRTQRRKIAGNAAPLRKNLARYLAQHTQCELYVQQDRVTPQQTRVEARGDTENDGVFCAFDLEKFISLSSDDDVWKSKEFHDGVLPPLSGWLEIPN